MQDVKDLIIFILEYLTGKYIHRGGGWGGGGGGIFRKIIFGSELSEAKMSQLLGYTTTKKSKNYFWVKIV